MQRFSLNSQDFKAPIFNESESFLVTSSGKNPTGCTSLMERKIREITILEGGVLSLSRNERLEGKLLAIDKNAPGQSIE